jgi:hypothetical protein
VILSRSDGHLLISLNGQKHKIDLSI